MMSSIKQLCPWTIQPCIIITGGLGEELGEIFHIKSFSMNKVQFLVDENVRWIDLIISAEKNGGSGGGGKSWWSQKAFYWHFQNEVFWFFISKHWFWTSMAKFNWKRWEKKPQNETFCFQVKQNFHFKEIQFVFHFTDKTGVFCFVLGWLKMHFFPKISTQLNYAHSSTWELSYPTT